MIALHRVLVAAERRHEPGQLRQRHVVARIAALGAVEPRLHVRRLYGRVAQPARNPLKGAPVDPRPLDEEHVQPLVALLGEQQAAGRQAVAPASAGLLVIGLERAGDSGMADGADVGLVDPHPERVGRDDHPRGT